MKQILQHARTGEVMVAEVPEPQLLPGCVLVQVVASVVSAGTERASAEFAKKSLLAKAKARPDLVRDALTKARRDGLWSAATAVRSRLEVPTALGYSSAGIVTAVAPGVANISVGDRVACAGAGHAVHAEYACIPQLLTAKIFSDSISFEEASFTTLGAVSLHGLRTASVQIGDTVAVIGLGLMGQITVQLLKASGCTVLGMDIRSDRCQLALQSGADAVSSSAVDFRNLCATKTGGNGVDEVLVTAETSSSEPVSLAGEVLRDRGTVAVVGTVGMDIPRKVYYEKELDFRISRSYGPGRYDSAYEQKGRDYPIGYVRWTETRNMEAFLRLIAERKLNLKPLITHRYAIHEAAKAYELLSHHSEEPSLGIVISYDEPASHISRLELVAERKHSIAPHASLNVGLVGAGTFATDTLLPAMTKVPGVKLIGVCSANGSHSRHAASKFGFQYCASNDVELLDDRNVNTLVIATRHHLHASQVLLGLKADKHVFCEKPLCLTKEDLSKIGQTYSNLEPRPLLMVGFNRRFAPMALRLKNFVGKIREPLAMHYRINAGYIPRDHWIHDPEQGGGRLLGEVCHFIDFLSFLTDAAPVEVFTRGLRDGSGYSDDNLSVVLEFPNGSQGTISYFANGDRAYSKERIEVFGGKSVAVLEDFRRLDLVANGKKQVFRSPWRQDKGHVAEWKAFSNAIISGGESPISFDALVGSTLATLAASESQYSGKPVQLDVPAFLSAAVRPTSV